MDPSQDKVIQQLQIIFKRFLFSDSVNTLGELGRWRVNTPLSPSLYLDYDNDRKRWTHIVENHKLLVKQQVERINQFSLTSSFNPMSLNLVSDN